MIQKKDRSNDGKLQLIQIIEANFNAATKILLNRRLMRQADTKEANIT